MRLTYKLLNSDEIVHAYNSYKSAESHAKRLKLKLAEYGDVYGYNISYCYWNKSGNRNDNEKVIAYYTFENGKPKPLNLQRFRDYLYR